MITESLLRDKERPHDYKDTWKNPPKRTQNNRKKTHTRWTNHLLSPCVSSVGDASFISGPSRSLSYNQPAFTVIHRKRAVPPVRVPLNWDVCPVFFPCPPFIGSDTDVKQKNKKGPSVSARRRRHRVQDKEEEEKETDEVEEHKEEQDIRPEGSCRLPCDRGEAPPHKSPPLLLFFLLFPPLIRLCCCSICGVLHRRRR